MAQKTSEIWKELFRAGARREYGFEIDGVWYGGEAEVSHHVDSGLFEEFGIGNASAAKLTLDILAEAIPRGATVKRYVRLKGDGAESEWLAAGVFHINRRSEEEGRWQIEAFDGMRKGDAPWEPGQSRAFPMGMQAAAEELARTMGCELDPRTEIHGGYTVDDPANGVTVREVLQFIAAAQGGNWVMTGEGKLRLVPLRGTGENHEIGLDLTGFQDKGKKKAISRVTLAVDEERTVTAGDGSGMELTASCPYATQEMAEALLDRLGGYEYRMYAAESVNLDPAAELGDGITADGVASVIARLSEDGSGYPGAEAPGEAELEDEFPSAGPLTKAVERKLAETRSAITQTAAEIRLEVEDVNGSVSSLSQTVGGFDQRIKSAEGSVSSLTQTVSGISSQVTGLDGKVSSVELTAGKINWIVNSGTGAANFTLTDRVIQLVAGKIDLTGFVTFSNLSTAGQTTINGANIVTGSVTADKIKVTDLNALGATIGGWTIGTNGISYGMAGLHCLVARPIQSDLSYGVIYVGTRTSTSNGFTYPFRVNGDGSFYAANANITGVISANSFTLNGYKISIASKDVSVTRHLWNAAGQAMTKIYTSAMLSIDGGTNGLIGSGGLFVSSNIHSDGNISGKSLDIESAYIDSLSARNVEVYQIKSGYWLGSPIDIAYGGTGATNAAAARTALGITAENLGLVFKAGETLTISTGNLSGYVTSSTKALWVTLFLPKPIASGVSSVTVTAWSSTMRGPNGYLNSNSSSIDLVSSSEYTIATSIDKAAGIVRFTVTKSSAFTNVSNNQVVNMTIAPLTIKFN